MSDKYSVANNHNFTSDIGQIITISIHKSQLNGRN